MAEAKAAEQQFNCPKQYAGYLMMFQQGSQGKDVITLAEAAQVASSMLNMMLFPMVDAMMSQEMIEGQVTGLAAAAGQEAPPVGYDVYGPIIQAFVENIKTNLVSDMEQLLAGPFQIIDSNGTGAISKKEFLGVVLMAITAQQAQSLRGNPGLGDKKAMANQLLDALFYTVDADDNGELSKEEITQYIYNIATGAATTVAAALEIVRKSIPDEFYGTVVKMGYQVGGDAGVVADGLVQYQTVAPMISMMDQQFSGLRTQMTQQSEQNLAMMTMAKKAEVEFYKALEEAAAGNDSITKEQMDAVYATFVEKMKPMMQQMIMAGVPAEAMEAMPPPAKAIFMMLPQAVGDMVHKDMMPRTRAAMFDTFGDGETLKLEVMKTFIQVTYGAFDEGEAPSPEERCKTLFGLFDVNTDGAVSEDEAARMVKNIVNMMFAVMQDAFEMYGELFGNKQLWTQGIDMALQMASAMGEGLPFVPSLPLKKQWCVETLEMLAGQVGGGGGDGMSPEEKVQAIVSCFDTTESGALAYAEMSKLIEITGDGPIPEEQYKAMCQMFGDVDPEVGFTAAHLMKGYEQGAGDIDEDYAKAVAYADTQG